MSLEFKYILKGSSVIKPIVSEEKDRFLATASLAELGKYIPNIDTSKNIDLLPFACDAFIANRANKNDDISDGKTSIAIAKLFVNKPVNIEHKRDQVMGVILNYGFSEFGSDKILTQEEAEKLDTPFNIVLGGVIWRIINPKIAKLIEECSDPSSEHFKAISASWEVGFLDFSVASVEGDSKNLSDMKIISNSDEIEKIQGYMKAFGGKGSKEGNKLYRLVKGDNVLPLGIGLTGTPAADVKGVATQKTIEDKKPEKEKLEEAGGKPPKSSYIKAEEENIISQDKENNVIQERNAIAMSVKITKIEDITDDTLKQAKASEITDLIKSQLKEADIAFQAEKNKLETQVKASEEAAKTLQTGQAKLQEDLKKVTETLAALQTEKEARTKQDAFNSRMAGLDTEFDLVDAEREVIASDIVSLDETAFASYKKKLDVLLAAKKKVADKKDVKKQSMQEQKSTPDNGNAKTGADPDSDTGNSKKELKTAKASENVEGAKETVAAAIDNAKVATGAVPATIDASEPSMINKFSKAFGVDQWISDVKLTD